MLNTLGKEANPPFSVPFSLVNVFPLCREWGQKSLPMYKMNRCDPVMLVYGIGMSHLFFLTIKTISTKNKWVYKIVVECMF